MNDILLSIFSNFELQINSQQLQNSNEVYAHSAYISINLKEAISEYKRVLHCDGYDYEKFPVEFMEGLLTEPFFTRRIKLINGSDGCLLCGKLDFFSTSKMLHPNTKNRVQLIIARPYFYIISGNPNVSHGIVDDFTLVVFLSRMIITINEKTCSCGIQLVGGSSKDFHHSR